MTDPTPTVTTTAARAIVAQVSPTQTRAAAIAVVLRTLGTTTDPAIVATLEELARLLLVEAFAVAGKARDGGMGFALCGDDTRELLRRVEHELINAREHEAFVAGALAFPDAGGLIIR